MRQRKMIYMYTLTYLIQLSVFSVSITEHLHRWTHFPVDDNVDAVAYCVCGVHTHLLQEKKSLLLIFVRCTIHCLSIT